jgi:hypothetical protein
LEPWQTDFLDRLREIKESRQWSISKITGVIRTADSKCESPLTVVADHFHLDWEWDQELMVTFTTDNTRSPTNFNAELRSAVLSTLNLEEVDLGDGAVADSVPQEADRDAEDSSVGAESERSDQDQGPRM